MIETYYFYCVEGTNLNGAVKKISGIYLNRYDKPDEVYRKILSECKDKLPCDRVVLVQFNKVG